MNLARKKKHPGVASRKHSNKSHKRRSVMPTVPVPKLKSKRKHVEYEQQQEILERRVTRSSRRSEEMPTEFQSTNKTVIENGKGPIRNETKYKDGSGKYVEMEKKGNQKRSEMGASSSQNGKCRQGKKDDVIKKDGKGPAMLSIGNSRNRRKYGQRDHSETSQCKAIEVQVHSPPIKTRRWAKMRRRLIPRCRVCKGDSGALMKCIYCQRQYHLRCLEYECERERSIAEKRMEDWLCPACALCTACGDFITDRENVQCLSCDRAYHGACRPSSVGYPQSCESFKTFFCPECMSKEKPVIKKEVMDLSAATHHSANGRSSSMHSSKVSSSLYLTRRNNSFLLRCALGPKYPLQQQRDQINDRLKDKMMTLMTKDEEKSKFRRTVSPGRAVALSRTSHMGKNSMELESNSPQKVKEVGGSKNSGDEDEPRRRKASKAGKFGLTNSRLQLLSTASDYQLFVEAKENLRREVGEKSEDVLANKENLREQWVHYANHEMKAVNESPFPKVIASSPHLYICHFCLKTDTTRDRYDVHMQHCVWRHPPGNEIYREDQLSFWEIDGAVEAKYCTRLCLLSILFLPSKVAYRDMETFIFYLLTEKTDCGDILVGYFSKEKRPSQNNNLSCIMVLPIAQRAGYGKLLIDLSYKISLRERKVGGPEHPLSDLGLLTYRSYWKAAIISYIRKNRGRSSISLKEVSYETGIHTKDVVSTLTLYSLLLLINDVYYIDVKKVLRLPLSSFRHRVMHDSRLKWKPSFEVDNDPSKMGAYND